MERVLDPHSGWNPNADIGYGIPEHFHSSQSALPRNVIESVVRIRTATQLGTGFLVRFQPGTRRSPRAHEVGACDVLSGSYVTARKRETLLCVITCHHVIRSIREARGTTLSTESGTPIRLRPDRLFYTSDCNDITCCAVEHAGVDIPTLSLIAWSDAFLTKRITIIHYPNSSFSTVNTGRIISRTLRCFLHTADTMSGSSGGPILLRYRRGYVVVGVHCQSVDVMTSRGMRPFNMGCTLNLIVRTMKRLGYEPHLR